MIKAYSVKYDEEAKKTIDTHLRIDKELESRKKLATLSFREAPVMQEGFVEGLQAVVVESLPANDDIREKAAKITEDAKNEAIRLIDQAKKEAEKIRNDAYAAAQKKGYDEGMAGIRKESMKLKAEYDEKNRQLQKEYNTMAEALEPQMVKIIAALVEKITGIVVEDKEDVILFLVNRAIKNMDKSDEYAIRVSKEDFEYISMRKNLLLGSIGREALIDITEDVNLKKNQCLIETGLKVINCSLDVQLNNLITDLKLLSGI